MADRLTISELNIFSYIADFSEFRTGLSDYYVRTMNCLTLGAYNSKKKPVGILVAEFGVTTEIFFLKVTDDEPEYKRVLIDYLANNTHGISRISFRLPEDSSHLCFAKEYGFKCSSTLLRFQTVGAESPSASEIIEIYEKLYQRIEKCGYITKSFDNLSKDELYQITADPNNEFAASLNPEKFLSNPLSGTSKKLSFATVKDGNVVGYTIVRNPSRDKYIFEIICIAASVRKSGVFILPFLDTVKALKNAQCEKVFFAIYESNSNILPLVRKHFGKLIASESIQYNFSKNIGEN